MACDSTLRRRRSPSRSRTTERRRRWYDDEMRGRRTRAQPRHGETGGEEGCWRCAERFEKEEVVEGRARRLRSEIGEVSGSLRRITRGEFLADEVFARSPPRPQPPFSSQVTTPGGTDVLLLDGHQGGASSSSLSQPAVPRPTVRTSSSAAAANLERPPKAAATASPKKRKTGPESSPKATTTSSSKRTKTVPALGQPEVHRQENNKSPVPSAPKPPPPPPTKRVTRFPPIPLPPPNHDEELATHKRREELRKTYARLVTKSQDVIGLGHREDVLEERANPAAEVELLRRREAERAKAREALQEVEREARRTGLFVERILPEHLRELDITGDIEYLVSPEGHRGEDGVLRFTPPRYSPVAEMLGLFVKANDGGELEVDEE